MVKIGMRRQSIVMLALASSGCFAFLTKEDGVEIHQQIADVRNQSSKNEIRAAELSKEMEAQLKRVRQLVEEATKVVERNSADLGLTVQKMQTDLAQLTGRIDDIQHTQDALTKQFQEFRASSDTKLEQLTQTNTAAKTPPVPDTADGLYADAEKRLQALQYVDARRELEAFINRYPQDPRAAHAQYNIGESYAGEKRWANAIGAYTKVVDNFPKADIVQDAMFKNGLAFYALKYCSDARVYFQELLKRYPKTTWKKDAAEELKKIQRDQKNKTACSS